MNAEASNNDEVYANRFGLNLKNIRAKRFGGTKSIVNFMISDMCSKLHAKGVQLIICTSHSEEQEEKEIANSLTQVEILNQLTTVIEEHGVQPLPKLRKLVNDKGYTYSMPEIASALKDYKESNSD